jgi:hypothetical protein
VRRGKHAAPKAPGFSKTIRDEITGAGRIDYPWNATYTHGAAGDPHGVVWILTIDLGSHETRGLRRARPGRRQRYIHAFSDLGLRPPPCRSRHAFRAVNNLKIGEPEEPPWSMLHAEAAPLGAP